MGIKDLCKNLVHINGLESVELNKISRNSIIFYDFGGLFYSILAVSDSDSDFLNKLANNIDYKNRYLLKEQTQIIFFIDSGTIQIKEKERMKRRGAISQSKNPYMTNLFAEKKHYNVLNKALEMLGATDDSTFTMRLDDNFTEEDWDRYIDTVIKYNVAFIKVMNFDAEFGCVMFAKQIYRHLTIWPTIMSNDQDTIALVIFNQPPDIEVPVLYQSEYKIIKSTRRTKLITFLSLIMNGSEYIKPISGVQCTPTFIDKINWSYYDSDKWFDFDMNNESKAICMPQLIRDIYRIKHGNVILSFTQDEINTLNNIIVKAIEYLSLDLKFFNDEP